MLAPSQRLQNKIIAKSVAPVQRNERLLRTYLKELLKLDMI